MGRKRDNEYILLGKQQCIVDNGLRRFIKVLHLFTLEIKTEKSPDFPVCFLLHRTVTHLAALANHSSKLLITINYTNQRTVNVFIDALQGNAEIGLNKIHQEYTRCVKQTRGV